MGEVLFDCFPDGSEVLGGAPFNVAWHLQGFGLKPLMISRIGEDGRGERVREAMQSHGLGLEGLQHDSTHPTGEVSIRFSTEGHHFDILADQAYDHIDAGQAVAQLPQEGASLLYFGSLINRSATSAETLQTLRRRGLPAFVDINLRQPWWVREGVEQLLQGVRWGKLNDEELRALEYGGPLDEAAESLRERHELEFLLVTRAAEGALLVHADGQLAVPAPEPERLVDTVGAGDAFAAIMILGLHRGWSARDTLQRAGEFASRICAQRGALPVQDELYGELMASWEAI